MKMMKKTKTLCLFLSVVAFCWVYSGRSDAQLEFGLRFEKSTSSFQPPFRWDLVPAFFGVDGITLVSPGGTEVSTSPIGIASFDTFEEFQDDVVGVWTMFFVTPEIQINFEIPKFGLGDFPQFEIVFPMEGDTFLSGEIIQHSINPPSFEPFSTGISISVPSNADVNNLGNNTFEVILDIGSPEASIGLTRIVQLEKPQLVENIQGDTELIMFTGLTIRAESERVFFNVVANPNLGDVNLDGSVDLLDVASFIERVSNGTFQIEADINLDDSVDLEDIAPFVLLLSSLNDS